MKGDYKIDEKSKRVSFTDKGMNHIDEILHKHNLIPSGTTVFDEQNFEFVHYFTQAVRAHILYHNDVDYVVKDGQVTDEVHYLTADEDENYRVAPADIELTKDRKIKDEYCCFKQIKRK